MCACRNSSDIKQLTRLKTVSAAPQDVLLPTADADVLVPAAVPVAPHGVGAPALAADQPLPLHAQLVGIGNQERPLPRPLNIPAPRFKLPKSARILFVISLPSVVSPTAWAIQI